jgi:hypothetical protein
MFSGGTFSGQCLIVRERIELAPQAFEAAVGPPQSNALARNAPTNHGHNSPLPCSTEWHGQQTR